MHARVLARLGVSLDELYLFMVSLGSTLGKSPLAAQEA